MSDANWGNIKDEAIELIDNMKKFCMISGFKMPTVDARMRLDVLQREPSFLFI